MSTSSGPLSPAVANNPDGSFFMATKQWLRVQCYVEEGVNLPGSSAEAVKAFDLDQAEADKLSELWKVYASIASHCITFQSTTFPSIVSLASSISEYGHDKAPIFFKALQKAAEDLLLDKSTAKKAAQRIKAIADSLVKDATARTKEANDVEAAVRTFIKQSQADQVALKPVTETVKSLYDGESGLVAKYETSISADKAAIQADEAAYERDVLLYETAPVYCVVLPPLGIIAVAVVAGVYGAASIEALESMGNAFKALRDDQTKLKTAVQVQQALALAESSVEGIASDLAAALPVLQSVLSIWTALHDRLSAILTELEKDVASAGQHIQALNVTNAIEDWKKLADQADVYREHAFVTVLDLDTVKAQLAADPNAYGQPKAE